MSGPPFLIREGPLTLGNHILWPLQVLCWKLPLLERVGTGISSLRFRLYMRYGWEWI